MQRLLVVVVTALVILLTGAGLAFGLFLATAALRNRSALSLLQRLYIASASAPLLLTIVVPPVVTLAFPAAVRHNSALSGTGIVLSVWLTALGLLLRWRTRQNKMLFMVAVLVSATPAITYLLILGMWRLV